MIQFIIIFTDTSYLDIFFNIDDRCKLISGQIFYIRQRDIPTKRNQFHLFQIRYNERQKEEPVEAVLIQIDIFKLLNSIRRNQVSSTSNGGCGCRLRDHARQSGTHEQTPQGCRPIFRVIADGNCPGMKSMLADFSQEKGKRDLIVFVCACSLLLPPFLPLLTILVASRFVTPSPPILSTKRNIVIDQMVTVKLPRAYNDYRRQKPLYRNDPSNFIMSIWKIAILLANF